MTHTRNAALWAVPLLCLTLGACPNSNRGVNKSSHAPADDAGATEPAESEPKVGSYQCRWRQGDEDQSVGCAVQNDKGKATLTLPLAGASVHGSVAPTDFGFHFSGALTHTQGETAQKFEADFFLQGEGVYASVLTLQDGSLVKLDIHR